MSRSHPPPRRQPPGTSPHAGVLRSLALSLLAAAVALLAAGSQAQGLPTCRDDLPRVLQPSTCLVHHRSGPAARADDGPPAPVRPAKKTLAELLRERDAAESGPRAAAEHRPDGANVLKTRMGAY